MAMALYEYLPSAQFFMEDERLPILNCILWSHRNIQVNYKVFVVQAETEHRLFWNVPPYIHSYYIEHLLYLFLEFHLRKCRTYSYMTYAMEIHISFYLICLFFLRFQPMSFNYIQPLIQILLDLINPAVILFIHEVQFVMPIYLWMSGLSLEHSHLLVTTPLKLTFPTAIICL